MLLGIRSAIHNFMKAYQSKPCKAIRRARTIIWALEGEDNNNGLTQSTNASTIKSHSLASKTNKQTS